MSIRVADVHLRGRSGTLPARVYRPATANPALLIVLANSVIGVDALCRNHSMNTGVVVLAAPAACVEDATAVVEWAADHAAELGADPENLLLTGAGAAAASAAAVARQSAASGWPVLRLLTELPKSPERTQ